MGNTVFCSNYPPYPKHALTSWSVDKETRYELRAQQDLIFNSHDWLPHISSDITFENLMLNQTIHVVTCLIFLYFLFSVLLDNVLLLYGEGTYWSLLGMKKSLIYFPFWCPSSQPSTKSTGKKVLVFLLSFISYKSLTCNFLIYLPYNSIKKGPFSIY